MPSTKQIKDTVIRSLIKWVPIVGVEHWDIHVSFFTDKKTVAQARASTQPQYQEVWLSFNLFKLKQISAIEVEKVVLHELCHTHSAALADHLTGHKSAKLVSYLDEYVTSSFAHALWRAHRRK